MLHAVQGKPTECDRHNADVTIVHVLHASDAGISDDELFDEFAAFFTAKFPTDTVGDVRAFVAGVYLDLKEEDQMCMEPEAPSGDVGGRSRSDRPHAGDVDRTRDRGRRADRAVDCAGLASTSSLAGTPKVDRRVPRPMSMMSDITALAVGPSPAPAPPVCFW